MSKVLYEKKGKIAYITLNRPKVNAVDAEMIGELDRIWDDFRDDDNLEVGIVSGAGNIFTAGADIGMIVDLLKGHPFRWRDSGLFGDRRSGPQTHSIWKPLIVAIEKICNGAGLWLALGCDIRIATTGTNFGLGEVRFNFPVEFSVFLSHYVPQAIANELLLGYNITAERAYDVGLINRVVPPEQLMPEAEAIANNICERNGPVAMRVQKELVHRSWDLDYGSALALSASMILPCVNSEDTIEGAKAFLEKRKPIWKGK